MTNGLFDLTGRVAIVTGASSGLGERFAHVLADAGASVVLAARRADRLEAVAASIPGSVVQVCDVTSADDRDALVARALQAFGTVDVLVSNAGLSGPSQPPESYPMERWERTIELNLTALFGLTQLVGRTMLEQGRGSIVHVASIMGLVAGSPFMEAGYAASKGGVVNLTRELGASWASKGVRVNAIAPGWFPTEMTQGMVEDERSMAYVERGCPMHRMGRPDELDGVLLFLASDASSYCTGQTIAVDGGWTAK